MLGESPYLLPAVVGFCVFVMLLIYWFGGKISAKAAQGSAAGKTAPYACGEDLPSEELKFDLDRFFIFAVYFLVFDVFAFILATSFNSLGLVPIMYTLIVLMAVSMLLAMRRYL
ncbi:MAG TPA: NADH-quinone oxidoreductase subunit A [Candidatus Krumholzibacteriaceae bacterium]|nr:NADH-quinone oxidoreductase subunit A [Candidatus Krumholzibacteriaceae bacterium]